MRAFVDEKENILRKQIKDKEAKLFGIITSAPMLSIASGGRPSEETFACGCTVAMKQSYSGQSAAEESDSNVPRPLPPCVLFGAYDLSGGFQVR